MTTQPSSQDLPALTALRAVAALLVFFYHFPPRDLGYAVDVVAGQGHVGVTVFFVLSGFLITVRYAPRFARGEHRFGDYFVRRAARILPLYFVVLTLTHLLSTGAVPFAGRWPEWTLTQALFAPSADDLTIPTSWSLTVEECFYAAAPLLFLAIAALRRRLGPTMGAAVALVTALVCFHLAGTLALTLTRALGATDLPYLFDESLLRSFTVFRRFPDFAVGVAAGLLFLAGHVDAVWQRARGAFFASLLALAGGALGFVAQVGMVRAGDDSGAAWGWNVVAAVASGMVVVALTCRRAPLSRLLSHPLPVYLGRVSYALYLIQLTPLGNGLLFRLLPGREGVHLVVLYVGMNVVAALLFELVEEPGREAVLAAWRRRSLDVREPARTRAARALSLFVFGGLLTVQYAVWAFARLPAVEEARVAEVLGPDSPDLVRAEVTVPPDDGREPRVRLPEAWRLGPVGDRRAPPSLLVFADGVAVPFQGARPPRGAADVAYYRRPRAEHLSLQIPASARLTIVNHGPLVALALSWSRLRDTAAAWLAPLVVLLAAGIAAHRSRREWLLAPRLSLALASALLVLWLAGGFHLQPWGPVVLVLEIAFLSAIARARGALPPEGAPLPG
ncbi:MAG: acyltransferase [Vicinamibacteria bacterium]